MKTDKSDKDEVRCPACNKSIDDLYDIQEAPKENESLYTCGKCGASFERKSSKRD